MAVVDSTVFSEYEVDALNIKIGGDLYKIACIGTLEEERDVRKVSKKCRGTVAKSRTYATGTGTIKYTAHMPWECYMKMHAMETDGLKSGVHGYGKGSFPELCATAHVLDEDGNEGFRAWPVCTASTGPVTKIENGAEEVAEVEVEMTFVPDSNGIGAYNAIAATMDESLKTTWMESFTPESVKADSL